MLKLHIAISPLSFFYCILEARQIFAIKGMTTLPIFAIYEGGHMEEKEWKCLVEDCVLQWNDIGMCEWLKGKYD